MTKPSYLVLVATLFGLVQGPAFGQNQGNAIGSTGSPSAPTRSTQPLPQRIQQKLASQGFTDIKVVPEGYIVSAKDKDGDPVTMVIGPHSIAMFTFGAANESSNAGEQGHYGSGASGTNDFGAGTAGSGGGAQGTGSMGAGRGTR